MTKLKYTSKQDAKDKGLTKKDGVFYKATLLELWYNKGWLEFEQSPFSAEDRLKCGLKLALDYQIVSRMYLHASYIMNSKIDISHHSFDRQKTEAESRYLKAVKAVPSEFWNIVRKICIEEQEPVVPKNISERQKTYFYYLCRTDLCRGLDRLIELYNHKLKNKNNSN